MAAGCGDDSGGADPAPDASASESEDGGVADGGGTGAGSDGDASEPAGSDQTSAFLVVNRVRTPDSRTIYYSVLPDLEMKTLDLSTAREVSGLSRVLAFEGNLFVFDGETGTVTKYEVNEDRSLSERETFSMMGVGVTNFRTMFTFINSTRAYYIDLDQLQTVVWNPSSMEIVDTFPIDEVEREGFSVVGGDIIVRGDRVYSLIYWNNFETDEVIPKVAAMILSATENELIAVAEDDRCALTGGGFLDDNDDIYIVGDVGHGFYSYFNPDPLPPPCMLRIPSGSEAFDEDYYVDLSELTGYPQISIAVGRPDRTFVTRVYNSDLDPTTLEDPRDYYNSEVWHWAKVDLDAETTQVYDSLPLSGVSFRPFEIEGSFFIQRVDEEMETSTLYRLDDDAMESVTAAGDIQNVQKIR